LIANADIGQRRLPTATEDDTLLERATLIREQVQLDLLKPDIEQLAHLVTAVDLIDRTDEHENAACHQQVHGLPKELDLFSSTAAELVIKWWIEVDHRKRVSRDARRLEAARAEQPHIGIRLRDSDSPARIQLDREDMTIRNTKAVGELHEGLSFSSTWVQNVHILGPEP
jgi:hypothetical protein